MLERTTDDRYLYINTKVPINRFDIRDLELVEALEDKLVATQMDAAIEKASKPRYLREAPWFAHGQIFRSLYKWAGKDRTVDLDPALDHTPAAFCAEAARGFYTHARKLVADGRVKEGLVLLALGFEEAQPFRRGTAAASAAGFAALTGATIAPDHKRLEEVSSAAFESKNTDGIEALAEEYLARIGG